MEKVIAQQSVCHLLDDLIDNSDDLDMMTLADSLIDGLYEVKKHLKSGGNIKFEFSDGYKIFFAYISIDKNGNTITNFRIALNEEKDY